MSEDRDCSIRLNNSRIKNIPKKQEEENKKRSKKRSGPAGLREVNNDSGMTDAQEGWSHSQPFYVDCRLFIGWHCLGITHEPQQEQRGIVPLGLRDEAVELSLYYEEREQRDKIEGSGSRVSDHS